MTDADIEREARQDHANLLKPRASHTDESYRLAQQRAALLRRLDEARAGYAALLKTANDFDRALGDMRDRAERAERAYKTVMDDSSVTIDDLNAQLAAARQALEKIAWRSVPMTARGEYRRGYMDALAATMKVATDGLSAALAGEKQT